MKRLLLLVSLSLVAVSSYAAHESGAPGLAPSGASAVSEHAKNPGPSSSYAKRPRAAHALPGVSEKQAQPQQDDAFASSKVVFSESIWVKVLLAARVHTGPSIDTPTSHFHMPGTQLRVAAYRQGWFEVVEPETARSGWIYRVYLGAIAEPGQIEVAAQEPPAEDPAWEDPPVRQAAGARKPVQAKSYAAPIPVAVTSREAPQAQQAQSRPRRDAMAGLLQRALSGY